MEKNPLESLKIIYMEYYKVVLNRGIYSKVWLHGILLYYSKTELIS